MSGKHVLTGCELMQAEGHCLRWEMNMLAFFPSGRSFVCFATGTLFESLLDRTQWQTHRLMLKVRVAVTAITAVAPAALQGSGELLVLAPQLADGAPQVQHQLVLGVQDAQGVALHPQGHAGKVERVQGLLSLSLCTQANGIQDRERHRFVEVHHQLFPGGPRCTRGCISPWGPWTMFTGSPLPEPVQIGKCCLGLAKTPIS